LFSKSFFSIFVFNSSAALISSGFLVSFLSKGLEFSQLDQNNLASSSQIFQVFPAVTSNIYRLFQIITSLQACQIHVNIDLLGTILFSASKNHVVSQALYHKEFAIETNK
jgi:hypothetical protein